VLPVLAPTAGVAVPLDPVEILQQLVRTPSVNPMNQEVTGSSYGESRLTDLLVNVCNQHGWQWSRHEVHPGRDNLLAVIPGAPTPMEGGELLLWDVHQDTVPVDGMTIEPFAGEVRDGRVYGRGACDVKGSMAAMLAALSRRTVNRTCPTIVLACTVNEECGYTGAQALSLLATRDGPSSPSNPIPRAPDAVVVAEPTGLNVVVAHQGQVRWRCHTVGRAAHTSQPDVGVNAIYAMAGIIQAVERCHRELSSDAPAHPLCGRPSVCVSTIRGGVGINTVPERATIEIDRRLAPGESPEIAYQALIQFVAGHADSGHCRVEHDQPFMQSKGLVDDANRPLAERLARLVRGHGAESSLAGARFGTDAAAMADTGAPAVVFGPGSIDQAHTADEFIAIDELCLAAEIFYDIACLGLRS
jgi:acetylornithine deacetylase